MPGPRLVLAVLTLVLGLHQTLVMTGWGDSMRLSVRYQLDGYTRPASLRQGQMTIQLLDTDMYGEALFLDGRLFLPLSEEATFHEALVLPAMMTHPSPQNVLVLGDVGGGALRQVLASDTVRRAVVTHFDLEWITFADRHLDDLIPPPYGDSRLEIWSGDCVPYLRPTDPGPFPRASGVFDLVVVNLPPPNTPTFARFYTREFYELLKRNLTADGLVVTHTGPMFRAESLAPVVGTMQRVFERVIPYREWIPAIGQWGYCIGSRLHDPREVDPSRIRRRLGAARYDPTHYDEAYHFSYFQFDKLLYHSITQASAGMTSLETSPVVIPYELRQFPVRRPPRWPWAKLGRSAVALLMFLAVLAVITRERAPEKGGP